MSKPPVSHDSGERLRRFWDTTIEGSAGEVLRRSISRDLVTRRSLISAIDVALRHPVALTMIAFGLTGLAGAGFTEYLRRDSWSVQQRYLAESARRQTQRTVLARTTEAIADYLAAADEILTLVVIGSELSADEIADAKMKWRAARLSWKSESQIIAVEIAATFGSERARVEFEVVRSTITALDMRMNKLLLEAEAVVEGEGNRAVDTAQSVITLRGEALDLVESVVRRGELRKLTSAMVEEIERPITEK